MGDSTDVTCPERTRHRQEVGGCVPGLGRGWGRPLEGTGLLRAWKAPTGQTSLAHRHECARSPRTARRANPSTHKEWKGSRTPTPSSARRGGSSRVRARCPGHPAGRGAWVAQGQAEPEQEAVPRGAGPGQGRGGGGGPGWPAWLRGRKCSKWGHRNTGPRADMAVASATADVGQQTVTRSPEVQEPGRLTETDGPTALGGGEPSLQNAS